MQVDIINSCLFKFSVSKYIALSSVILMILLIILPKKFFIMKFMWNKNLGFCQTPSPLLGWYPKFPFFVRHPCNLDITVSNIGLWSFSLQIPTAHGIIISRIYGISQIHSHPVEEVDTARENENYIYFICSKDWMLIQTTGCVNFKHLISCFLETYPRKGGWMVIAILMKAKLSAFDFDFDWSLWVHQNRWCCKIWTTPKY